MNKLKPMDVERTIEFILQSQARAEARMDAMDARMEARDARLGRRIDAIGKLVQQGMKMLVVLDKKMTELAAAQKDLAASQKITDKKFQAFLDSFSKDGNGRNRH